MCQQQNRKNAENTQRVRAQRYITNGRRALTNFFAFYTPGSAAINPSHPWYYYPPHLRGNWQLKFVNHLDEIEEAIKLWVLQSAKASTSSLVAVHTHYGFPLLGHTDTRKVFGIGLRLGALDFQNLLSLCSFCYSKLEPLGGVDFVHGSFHLEKHYEGKEALLVTLSRIKCAMVSVKERSMHVIPFHRDQDLWSGPRISAKCEQEHNKMRSVVVHLWQVKTCSKTVRFCLPEWCCIHSFCWKDWRR